MAIREHNRQYWGVVVRYVTCDAFIYAYIVRKFYLLQRKLRAVIQLLEDQDLLVKNLLKVDEDKLKIQPLIIYNWDLIAVHGDDELIYLLVVDATCFPDLWLV